MSQNYKNVAFIPVRGGSKSIPYKNIKEINGKPLVYWSAKAANDCEYIDKVYICTENECIKNVVNNFIKAENLKKISVIDRSEQSARDTASTEEVMLEFASKYSFENIILLQATSPLVSSEDINNAFTTFNKENIDSVLSVVRQKRFIWKQKNEEIYEPLNYDVYNRPLRQEFEGFFVENGAVYITSKDKLIESRNRVSGNIAVVEMNEKTYFEIDEPEDWLIVEGLMKLDK